MNDLLVFNITEEKKQGLVMISGMLRKQLREVRREEQLFPLHILLEEDRGKPGSSGIPQVSLPFPGTAFSEEMLVISGFSEEELDMLLHLLRTMNVRIPLKAVVTAHNRDWNAVTLYRQLKEEHELMNKNRGDR